MTDWTQPDPNAAEHWRDMGREIGAVCTIGECDLLHHARGMCRAHYMGVKIINAERRRHGHVPVDDVEWLLECHPLMTTMEMAPRFEVSMDGLRTALRRAGRQDLVDRLTRNAAVAGAHVRVAS